MAKVPNRLQVTVPRGAADQFGLRPGDEIEILPGKDSLRIVRAPEGAQPDVEERVKRFDQATQRQRDREKRENFKSAVDRGWKREDLYDRGRPD